MSKPCPLDTGVPQGSVLEPLYTRSLGSVIKSHHTFFLSLLRDNQLFLSFPSFDSTLIATRISECRADISTWTTAHHLKLNLNKTELLLMSGKSPHMDLLVTAEDITVSSSTTARNLSVLVDIYAAPQTSLWWPGLMQIRSSYPASLTETHSWLVSLPARLNLCSVSRTLQNPACDLFRDLHWLSVVARIRFKTMVLAYPHLPPIVVKPHTPARALCSPTSSGRLVPPIAENKQRLIIKLFSVLALNKCVSA